MRIAQIQRLMQNVDELQTDQVCHTNQLKSALLSILPHVGLQYIDFIED